MGEHWAHLIPEGSLGTRLCHEAPCKVKNLGPDSLTVVELGWGGS